MGCCHYYEFVEGNESVFAVDPNAIRFGPGVLREIGHDAQQLGFKRVALFTDRTVRELEPVAVVTQAPHAAGVDVVLYDEVHVELTDQSFMAATRFASEGKFDGFVSVGGGSVIDTCKAADLYSSYPAGEEHSV